MKANLETVLNLTTIVFGLAAIPILAAVPYTFRTSIDGPATVQLRDRAGKVVGTFAVPAGGRMGVWSAAGATPPLPPPPPPGERLFIHAERVPPPADLGPHVEAVVREGGGQVLIRGRGFGARRGPSSAVWWNAVPATVLSWSETQIRVRLPAGRWKGRPVIFVRDAQGRYRQGVVP